MTANQGPERSSSSRARLTVAAGVALGVVGVLAAGFCALMAYLLAPEAAFFGDRNSTTARIVGIVCGLMVGPLLLAGFLVSAFRQKATAELVAASTVAVLISGGALLFVL